MQDTTTGDCKIWFIYGIWVDFSVIAKSWIPKGEKNNKEWKQYYMWKYSGVTLVVISFVNTWSCMDFSSFKLHVWKNNSIHV